MYLILSSIFYEFQFNLYSNHINIELHNDNNEVTSQTYCPDLHNDRVNRPFHPENFFWYSNFVKIFAQTKNKGRLYPLLLYLKIQTDIKYLFKKGNCKETN